MGGYRLNPLLRHGFQHEQDFNFEIKDGDGNVIDIVASFDKVREDLSKKVNKEQGAENRNKVLVTDNNGKVALSSNLLMTSAERSKLAKITEDKFITTEERDKLARISNVLIFKNVLPRESDLTNISQKTVGDVYYVTNSEADGSISYKQYVWTGDRWAVLGTSQNIKVTELQAADHIRIQDDTVSAHSFVPQYDSVSKVLPHEKIFHYIGETTDKFTHGYFYERGEGVTIHQGAGKIGLAFSDGMVRSNPFLDGVFYVSDIKGIDLYVYEKVTGVGGNPVISTKVAEVGDKLISYNFELIITGIDTDDGIVSVEFKYGSGTQRGTYKLYDKVSTRKVANDNGEIFHWTTTRVGGAGSDLCYFPNRLVDSFGTPESLFVGVLNEGEYTLDHNIIAGSDGWRQLNVQPTSPPFDSTDIENRLDSLQAEKATLSELAEVARTGDYNSLLNRPNVKVSEGTKEFWNTNKTYVPISGEIVIVSDFSELNGINIPNLKIGDGSAFVADLPYLIDNSEIAEHLKNQNIHISQQDRDNWNSKVSASISEETLILN